MIGVDGAFLVPFSPASFSDECEGVGTRFRVALLPARDVVSSLDDRVAGADFLKPLRTGIVGETTALNGVVSSFCRLGDVTVGIVSLLAVSLAGDDGKVDATSLLTSRAGEAADGAANSGGCWPGGWTSRVS